MPQALREGARVGRVAQGLGVSLADRSAMGIRVPGGNDNGDRFRGQDQQQSGEFSRRQTVQRGPGWARARSGDKSRQLSAQRLGVTRHARQRRRMVSRLVSHAFAGRHRSRSVERSREQEPHRRLLKIATRQRLYRSWLGLPLSLPTAVRARQTLRSYWLSSGCCSAVGGSRTLRLDALHPRPNARPDHV